jgi:hypothetical protein
MHDIKKTFDKLLPIIKNFSHNLLQFDGNIKRTGPKPKFSDLEVITMALTAELLTISSENLLFKKLNALNTNDRFQNLIDRSQFNVRRRNLKSHIEHIRKQMVDQLIEHEDTFIIDSMPFEICKFVRAPRAKICRENFDTAPAYGYCASQKTTYFGYKLHSVCSLAGVITSFDLSKANFHDIDYLEDIRDQYSDCSIIGDKGYLSYDLTLDLFETANIRLETPMRNNQKDFKPFSFVFRMCRKRIETVYSQLCDQFLFRRNYSKSFSGLATRILSKITAFTLLQYLNKFVLDRPLGHVKHAFI